MDDGNRLETVKGWRRTIGFALPSMAMMLFISSYTMVDGAFISNLMDTDALAACNILMPLFSVLTGLGFMFATGGSAYVANLMGRGEDDRARGAFTSIVLFAVAVAMILTVLSLVFMEPLVGFLGADEVLKAGSMEYGTVISVFCVFFILQYVFNQMLIVAGCPGLSLALSVAGGLTNIILDYVFIGVVGWGLTGAAIASGCGALIPTVVGLVLFSRGGMTLRFRKPVRDPSVITSTCTNGISEMASELSGGITTLLFNVTMMEYVGPDGVSAITILMYAQFLAIATVIGYSNGVAPVMSYNHGKGDREGMQCLYRISMMFVLVFSVAAFVVMESFSSYIVGFFAEGSDGVMGIAVAGAAVFAFAFLAMGFNVYASSLFTSLSNGLVSALISVMRSLLLLAPLIVLLPMSFGIGAVWYAVPVTEFATLVLSVLLMLVLGRGYGFIKGVTRG